MTPGLSLFSAKKAAPASFPFLSAMPTTGEHVTFHKKKLRLRMEKEAILIAQGP